MAPSALIDLDCRLQLGQADRLQQGPVAATDADVNRDHPSSHSQPLPFCARLAYAQVVTKSWLLLLPILAIVGCAKPNPVGEYNFNALSDKVKSKIPFADKLDLSVKDDGSMVLSVAKLPLIQGTWVQKGDHVTFSKGGVIATEYRIDKNGLIPIEAGKEGTDWQFKRKP